jgi:hypothetical protein
MCQVRRHVQDQNELVNEAYEHLLKYVVKYRFVIGLASLKKNEAKTKTSYAVWG